MQRHESCSRAGRLALRKSGPPIVRLALANKTSAEGNKDDEPSLTSRSRKTLARVLLHLIHDTPPILLLPKVKCIFQYLDADMRDLLTRRRLHLRSIGRYKDMESLL